MHQYSVASYTLLPPPAQWIWFGWRKPFVLYPEKCEKVRHASPCTDIYVNITFYLATCRKYEIKISGWPQGAGRVYYNDCTATSTSLLSFLITEESSGAVTKSHLFAVMGMRLILASSPWPAVTEHNGTWHAGSLRSLQLPPPPGSPLQVKCGGLAPSRQEKKETVGLGKKGLIKISMWNFHHCLASDLGSNIKMPQFQFWNEWVQRKRECCYWQPQSLQEHVCAFVSRIPVLITWICKTK